MKNFIKKMISSNRPVSEEISEEEDFWLPGGWVDNRSDWERYDEMPWNG